MKSKVKYIAKLYFMNKDLNFKIIIFIFFAYQYYLILVYKYSYINNL